MPIAVGMIETRGFPAVVEAADAMVKAARVTLVGYEKIGSGHCTAVVRGNIADVRLAVEEGAKTQVFLCSSFKVHGKGGGNYIDCVDNSKGLLKFKYILAAHSLRHSVDVHLWEESEALIEKHS